MIYLKGVQLLLCDFVTYIDIGISKSLLRLFSFQEYKYKVYVVVSDNYWSSSANASNSNYAWAVYFKDGDAYNGNKSYKYYVRCVQDR